MSSGTNYHSKSNKTEGIINANSGPPTRFPKQPKAYGDLDLL